MDYRFKLVVPASKVKKIEDALSWDKHWEFEKKLNRGEEISFPINLKDGKKLVLKVQAHKTEEEAEEYGGASSRIQLFDANGNLLQWEGMLTRNFFREWKLEYGGDTYIVNAVKGEES